MDPALGGVFDAPSTANSSGAASSAEATSAHTAEFGTGDGRTSSPSTTPQRGRYLRYRDDAATPIGDMIAAPATSISPVTERERGRKPGRSERSSRSTSIKVITINDSTLKSKDRTPRSSTSPRVTRGPTADELLDIEIKKTLARAGRASTPERIPVMDQPHLLVSPDPLMQTNEDKLTMVAPIPMSLDPTNKPDSVKSTDSELLRDLDKSLMSSTRPAPSGEEASSSNYDRKKRRQECAACIDAAEQIKSDRNIIESLQRQAESTNAQVALLTRRTEMAEASVNEYQTEISRINIQGEAQAVEWSSMLALQREQLTRTDADKAILNNELADSRFEMQRQSELAASKDRELQYANHRINDLVSEGQRASELHRASLIAAEQQLQRACITNGEDSLGSAAELAEANINLGRLQNELSEKVRTVATYEEELRKSRDSILNIENDHNRFVVQHNRDQAELLRLNEIISQLESKARTEHVKGDGVDRECQRLTAQINQLNIEMAEGKRELQRHSELTMSKERELQDVNKALARANERISHLEAVIGERDAKVNSGDDVPGILARAAEEIIAAQSEKRDAQDELITTRAIFNQKISQIRVEHKCALEQSQSAISSLKSEVNSLCAKVEELTRDNLKLRERPIDVTLNKTVQQTAVGITTPVITPARSLSPSSTQVFKDAFKDFSSQIAALSAKVDQQAQRPRRGRSSSRTIFVGQPPGSGDGDPDDLGGSEGDEESSESEWDDVEGSGEDPSDDNASYGVNVRSLSRPTTNRGERIVTERRIREQDTVKVPNFPSLPSLTQWRIQISKNLVTASGHLDLREITWWGEIGLPENNFETLADSGERRFLSLDLKLSTALGSMLKTANNSVTQDVNLRETIATKQGTMLKGRQIAWLILKHFQTNPQLGVMYQITDFADLEWRGDKPTDVHTFMYIWENMLSQMHTSLSRHELAGILLQKLEKSTVLKEDIAHYHRQVPGHPDQSYEYLMNSMSRYLTRKRYDVNRVGGVQSIIRNMGGRGATPAVEGDAPLSKRAKAKAKKGAKVTKAVAAPADKGKGAGKGTRDKIGVCYFHNTEAGCTKTAKECKFEHKKLSAAEAAKLVKPPGRDSRASSPSPGGKRPGAKAKPKAGAKAKPKTPSYCFKYASSQGCQDKDCQFMHLPEDMVAEYKRSQGVLRKLQEKKP